MVNTSCCKGFLNKPHHLHFFLFTHFLYISWMPSPWMSINQQLLDLDILPSHEPRKAPLWVYSLDRRCTEVPGAQVATWNPSPRSRQPHPPRTKLTWKSHGNIWRFQWKMRGFSICVVIWHLFMRMTWNHSILVQWNLLAENGSVDICLLHLPTLASVQSLQGLHELLVSARPSSQPPGWLETIVPLALSAPYMLLQHHDQFKAITFDDICKWSESYMNFRVWKKHTLAGHQSSSCLLLVDYFKSIPEVVWMFSNVLMNATCVHSQTRMKSIIPVLWLQHWTWQCRKQRRWLSELLENPKTRKGHGPWSMVFSVSSIDET